MNKSQEEAFRRIGVPAAALLVLLLASLIVGFFVPAISFESVTSDSLDLYEASLVAPWYRTALEWIWAAVLPLVILVLYYFFRATPTKSSKVLVLTGCVCYLLERLFPFIPLASDWLIVLDIIVSLAVGFLFAAAIMNSKLFPKWVSILLFAAAACSVIRISFMLPAEELYNNVFFLTYIPLFQKIIYIAVLALMLPVVWGSRNASVLTQESTSAHDEQRNVYEQELGGEYDE